MKPPEPTSLEELDQFRKARIRFILDKYFIDNPLEPDDADIDMAITDLNVLIKSEQTKLLDRLEKQLPKRNNMLFNPVTRKKYHYSIKGYNKAIDQVLSAIESERKATLKRIEE